ncbi:MAG: pentapeptide repeat-containing protein [Blautia obeum]
MSEVKGYKVFNPDWTCRGFQYEVGKIFEEDVKPRCCDRGFHFCEKAADCFSYYSFNSENKVAEVVALGEVDTDGKKSCTNKIQIVREIPWQELLTIVNTGKDCTGFCNTGNRNTGNRNTGDCNTGDWNTGDRNTGDWNTGDRNTGNRNTGNRNTGNCNTGNRNTGNRNTGDCNTGDWNTGDRNTGDWNKSSFNTGCFNTEEQKITLFNKPSDITYNDWLRSDARYLLNQIPKDVVEWVYEEDMTDEEKAANPTYETTGGYLKVLNESECGQLWWGSLSDFQKNYIKSIPNFDAEIFEQCTGIKVDE